MVGSATSTGMAASPAIPEVRICGGPAPIAWGTQLFEERRTLADEQYRRHTRNAASGPAWVPIPFIAALALEQTFYQKAHAATAFAAGLLGLTFPADIELGLLQLDGVSLAIHNDDVRGPIRIDKIIAEHELASGSGAEIDRALLEFFNQLYDATGYERPTGLFKLSARTAAPVGTDTDTPGQQRPPFWILSAKRLGRFYGELTARGNHLRAQCKSSLQPRGDPSLPERCCAQASRTTPGWSWISVSSSLLEGYDEPEILRSSSHQFCLTSAEAGQWSSSTSAGQGPSASGRARAYPPRQSPRQ